MLCGYCNEFVCLEDEVLLGEVVFYKECVVDWMDWFVVEIFGVELC